MLFVLVPVVIFLLYVFNCIKILREYERGVIFSLGRLQQDAKGPGLILVFPPIQKMVRIDLRQQALEVPPQDIITRDNVTLKVNAVIYWRVVNAPQAVVQVQNYYWQTQQFAQTTLRSVLGEVELDELLAHRDKLNTRIQSILDQHTAPYGVKVSNVEVKQVDLPESMLRAMAKQAEAEREKRAKIIHAEGEFSASQRLHGSGAHSLRRAHRHPVALSANPYGNWRGKEHHHRLPITSGHDLRDYQSGRKDLQQVEIGLHWGQA